MRFKELTTFKHSLSIILENISLEKEISDRLTLINSLDRNENFDPSLILKSIDDISATNSNIKSLVSDAIKAIDDLLVSDAEQLLKNDSYISKFSEENTDGLDMPIDFLNENEHIIKNTIFKYVNWQYPAVHLHCRSDRTEYLVTGDPLYIAGKDHSKILNWISKYPDLYQRRLRTYTIKSDDYSSLPQNQFGFIFCWEFFNSLSVNRVKSHIENIINLLRPGGVLMFSYNNAELDVTANLIDQNDLPWASKQYIEIILKSVGYDIINFTDLHIESTGNYVSWVEAKKPGELVSLKRSQALGTIWAK